MPGLQRRTPVEPIELPAPAPATDLKPGQPWPLTEAANYLHVSVRTLGRAEEAGKLRLIRLGRLVYVPDAEIIRVAAEGL